jgi:hypothetical protein
MAAGRKEKAAVGALLAFVVAGSALLAVRRYLLFKGVIPANPNGEGGDFWGYLHAARQIAAGRSPYHLTQTQSSVGYVYSPFVALLLLPFVHVATARVWRLWTGASILAFIACAVTVMISQSPAPRSWRRLLLVGFAVLTTLEFAPTVIDLSNGQTDALVVVSFAIAALSLERSRSVATGAFIGLGALIKTWPAAAAVALFRRGHANRRREWVGFTSTVAVAPLLALTIGGLSQLVDFLKVTVEARSQKLVDYSVWGATRILFSHSGLARPVFASSLIRDLAALALAAWVIGLLAISLRSGASGGLEFWNVVGCVVLLLPVSHLDYSVYLLPILWIWVSRWLMAPRLGSLTFMISGALFAWWLVLFHFYGAGSATTSSLYVAIPFFANLFAASVSTLGGAVTKAHSAELSRSGPAQSTTRT